MKYTIQESKNYDQFAVHDTQRPILDAHVQRLMQSMKAYGYLPSQPIHVVKRAGRLVIINGHHRFKAAMALGIAVFYLITEDVHDDVVAAENVSKSWTVNDWCAMYAKRGIAAYVTLVEYAAKGIPMGAAAAMLAGQSANSESNVTSRLISGKFEIKDTEQIDLIAGIIKDLGSACPVVKRSQFIDVMSMCYKVHGFCFERMKSKIAANPGMLIKTANRQQMMDQVETVYNYRASTKVPLAFLATEGAKERAAKFGKVA